jgi:hypothetical protein
MKKLLMIFVLFVLGLCEAKAATHYAVRLQGSTQPYICVACGLRLPHPDKTTAETIAAWQEGKPPFADSKTHHGTTYTVSSGDIVNICNRGGCATYILDDSGNWGLGIFRALESHSASTSSASAKNDYATSKGAS